MKAHFGPMTSRPLAAPGLISYRYHGRYGFVMIGAKDEADALRQACRSIEGPASPEMLEVWNGAYYQPVIESPASG